jgi:hypothetical protein
MTAAAATAFDPACEPLLAAVAAGGMAPGVFADWLDEHDDPRAAAVRAARSAAAVLALFPLLEYTVATSGWANNYYAGHAEHVIEVPSARLLSVPRPLLRLRSDPPGVEVVAVSTAGSAAVVRWLETGGPAEIFWMPIAVPAGPNEWLDLVAASAPRGPAGGLLTARVRVRR